MGAYNTLDKGVAGLKYGIDARVESLRAAEAIPFGRAVFGYSGSDRNAYLHHTDRSKAVFNADFVASNAIAWNVNGTAGSTNFTTDQATTMAAIIAAIQAAVSGAVVTLDSSDVTNRTLFIDINGVNVVATFTVTGGVSQPVATITVSSRQVFFGISLFTQKEGGAYAINDCVNVLTEGKVYVTTAASVDANSAAYVVTPVGATQGLFSGTSSNNFATGCRFRETVSGAGLALVEVESAQV